jgi:phage tail sheath protein FI
MPEYLAPGVFVEETSFRARSIQGVGTSTAAFVGPTRTGPLGVVSDVITSFGEFQRIYGGVGSLTIAGARQANHMAHGAQAFFNNGGTRLYVSRVFTPRDIGGVTTVASNSAAVVVGAGAAGVGAFRARFPGAGLNGTIVAYEKSAPASAATLNAAPVGSLARAGTDRFVKTAAGAWLGAGAAALDLAAVPAGTVLVTLNLELRPGTDSGPNLTDRLGVDAAHPRSIDSVLAQNPTSRAAALAQPYWFDREDATTAIDLREALFPAGTETIFALVGGDDGAAPVATDDGGVITSYADALATLEQVDDIAIVAAPGHSVLGDTDFEGVQDALITHATRMRYRIAVLDTPAGQTVGEARDIRGRIDSTYGALYYPWVVVPNPEARPFDESIPKEIAVPPSGFICGIYARSDIQRGVWKAPANEVMLGALRFEREVTTGEQEVLNPEGVNCLRTFFGRGNRVWGARTVSSDPEWIYVNVRRYFIYLENSIDRSTQWAVFEPNGERLWASIRTTIESFLFNEWKQGALMGTTPEEAFFVRCDRSTMTQQDFDQGRLICEIGVAALKPAEFVIFRIGQKTADTSS